MQQKQPDTLVQIADLMIQAKMAQIAKQKAEAQREPTKTIKPIKSKADSTGQILLI